MRVYKSFKSVTICAIILSAACYVTGFLISIAADTPVGATVVIIQALVFVIFMAVGRLRKA